MLNSGGKNILTLVNETKNHTPPPPPPCKLKGRSLKNMTDLFVYSYYSKTFPIYKIHVGVYYIKHITPRFHVKLKTFLRSIQKNGVFIFI